MFCSQTFYGKAETQLFELSKVVVDAATEGAYRLEVTVNALQFTSHPLFTLEDRVASHLVALFADMEMRKAAKVTETLEGRLQALRTSVAQVEKQLKVHPLSQVSMCQI